jgi:hypothetical protein
VPALAQHCGDGETVRPADAAVEHGGVRMAAAGFSASARQKAGQITTKTGGSIDEPVPDDLVPYLEEFLRTWRPVLLRQASKFSGDPTHRRLWVDRAGGPMQEFTLRSLIERYTEKQFGTAVWPHLFRECLLTSVAIDQPELMSISAVPMPNAGSKAWSRLAKAAG